MFTEEDINEKVKGIILEQFGMEISEYDPTTKFILIGCDSLDKVELVMQVEEVFSVPIPDEDIGSYNGCTIDSPEELINYLLIQLCD